MKPKKLKVKNYASYIDETFDFDNAPHLFSVIGKNGAGKSTFFVDSITICLFNQGRTSDSRGSGLENLIKKGEDHFEISFTFETNNQIIEVIRRRFANKQELELYIDGSDHTEKIKETQEKITKLINMDYDTFLDTICIGQGESGRFMKKKPDERKEVLSRILDLERYEVLEEETKTMRKEAKGKLEKLEEKLLELQESENAKEKYENDITLSQKEVGRLEFEIEIKEADLEKELADKASHEQLVKSANYILSQRRNLKTQIENAESSISKGRLMKEQLEKTLESKEYVLSEITKVSQLVDDLQKSQMEISNLKSGLVAKNGILNKQITELRAKHTRLKDFNEVDCEFCGQPVTEQHKSGHLQQMFLEAKNLKAEIDENSSKITAFENKLDEFRDQLSFNKSALQRLQNDKTNIEQADAKLPGVISRLDELNSSLISYQKDYNEVMLVEVENVENRVFNDAAIRAELNSLRSQLNSYQTKLGIAQNELKKIEKDIQEISKIETQIRNVKKNYAIYDDLVTTWSKKGIQAAIIDSNLERIQDEINKFLEILSEGKVSVEIKTQKASKSGKGSAIETLDIIINDEDGSRVYESYSGGEKFRVDFACHVGLAKFLAKRAGSAIDFFILDEGIGSQDQEAKDQFIVAVNKLTTIFNKVMVITHIPDIIAAFPNRVEVYKDQIQGSKIRIVE